MFQYTALVTVFLLTIHESTQQGCVIDVSKFEGDEFGDSQPLVLSYDTYEVMYPPLTNHIDDLRIPLDIGQTIIISCHTGNLYIHPDLPPTTIATATCNEDSQLDSEGYIVDFNNYVKCRADHLESIRIDSSKKCSTNNTDSVFIEVGFDIGVNDVVVPLIEVCFDNATKTNLYSHHKLSKYIGFYHGQILTQMDIQDNELFDLPDVRLFDVYAVDRQKIYINTLLGLPEDSEKYINTNGTNDMFFCDMNLADADSFLYHKLQKGLFRYINVVPLWCSNLNLLFLQSNLNHYASSNQVDLDIYTGTYDVLKYPHEQTGEDVELFFYSDDVHGDIIPAPALIWKVVYEPLTQNAVTFVLINDPYKKLEDIVKVCDDIQDDLDWLTWDKEDVKNLLPYACTYEDLAQVIPLPELDVKGILK